ncbi:MAG: AmmeMemoRadiSam system protein B [Bdellovibrio bacteriovorus]
MARQGGWTALTLFPVLLLSLGLAALPGLAQDRVRPSALAGTWYPAEPDDLAQRVDGYLAEARSGSGTGSPVEGIRALVVPHAGYLYSGPTAAAAFALVRGQTYRRVLVLAPSHHGDFPGLSIADVDAYATPLGQVPLDREAVARLRQSSLVRADPRAHGPEHAIEIELPFLQRALAPGWALVPILVGRLDPEDYPEAAELLRPLVDEATLAVVSSDFTHYGARFGYLPFPPDAQVPARIRALDAGAIDRLRARDGPGLLEYQARTGITICGYRPLALLLHLLPADARVEQVAYATSGELTGDWRTSVSYAALAVRMPRARSAIPGEGGEATPTQVLTASELERLHGIAVLGVKAAVLGQSETLEGELRDALAGLPPALEAPAGAFVTLWSPEGLRGCIGHVANDLPLYGAVLQSAYQAARNDHRFRPLSLEELGALELEVNVLSPPEPIASPEGIRLGAHGITLRKGDHYGLYLPEVAVRMGWDLETTLSQLALKAGLPVDGWREGAALEVFTATHFRGPFPANALPPAVGAAPSDADQALTHR